MSAQMEKEKIRTADVVVIGAGPAGTVSGCLLQRAGMSSIVVDFATFPREKVCGGGLTPRAWHLLAELLPELNYDYLPVRHVRLLMEGVVKCEIDANEELRIVRRIDFDYELLKHYQAMGGQFINDAFQSLEVQADGRVLVTLKSGEQLLCRHLIGADGANSRVRKQLLGDYKGNVLMMEQYMEPGDCAIDVNLSRTYGKGYYYRFPSQGRDVVGFGDERNTVARYKTMMTALGVAAEKHRGANIPVESVVSPYEQLILIGDAGGFPNKLTYEGIYYAMVTARNACQSIIEGKPFQETNRIVFEKKRREAWVTPLFYSRFGLWLVWLGAHSRWLIKTVFDRSVG